MSESQATKKFKVNDRVKRAAVTGCYGTIKDVRAETGTHREDKDKNLLVQVLWDNGTLSYFSPGALEVVKE